MQKKAAAAFSGNSFEMRSIEMCREFNHMLAERNLIALQGNPYPGRGMIAGMDEAGQFMVQVYWIMGRGEDSRNRVFSVDGGRVFTEVADPSKMKDLSNRIYNAMREETSGPEKVYVVSNGKQTDEAFSGFMLGENLVFALSECTYEPDPSHTPRITAVCSVMHGRYYIVEMSILRKSAWGHECDRAYYCYERIANGFGLCLTTYSGDGNPLPAFRGEPLLMPLPGDIDTVLKTYWGSLNEENRVSLAVKFISIATGESVVKTANKYAKVG